MRSRKNSAVAITYTMITSPRNASAPPGYPFSPPALISCCADAGAASATSASVATVVTYATRRVIRCIVASSEPRRHRRAAGALGLGRHLLQVALTPVEPEQRQREQHDRREEHDERRDAHRAEVDLEHEVAHRLRRVARRGRQRCAERHPDVLHRAYLGDRVVRLVGELQL